MSLLKKFLGDIQARFLGLGGATGDATNVLSVRGPGSLFDGDDAGHQIRINKDAAGDTASFVFQTGFSGRAEFGTIGNDDFEIKVSMDGSAFTQAWVIDATTGVTDFKEEPTYLGQPFYHTGDFTASDLARRAGGNTFTGSQTFGSKITVNNSAYDEHFELNRASESWRIAPSTDGSLNIFRPTGTGVATVDFTADMTAFSLDLTGNLTLAGDVYLGQGLLGNDDFSIKVGSSFTEALRIEEDTGIVSFPAGVKVPRVINIAGRWYCETDNRWVGPSASYGVATENFSTNEGTGTEPAYSWADIYVFARAGTKVKDLIWAMRPNSVEVTGFNMRLIAQYPTSTQFESGTWDSNGETTFEDVISENAVTFTDTNWIRFNPAFTEYTMPRDGMLLIRLQPIGTITTRRYLYTSGEMILETPI